MALSLIKTEHAIKYIKDNFEKILAKQLNLTRVSAPLFVISGHGINDDLNGVEEPVTFKGKHFNQELQIVHSLAKWKRIALKNYQFQLHQGLYADMNAIRKDEIVDQIHSIYIDQWDFELIITKEERNLNTLKNVVKKIVKTLQITSKKINKIYPELNTIIDNKVTFVTSKQLLKMYPNQSVKERERLICQKHSLVFVIGIGDTVIDNIKYDNRSPDYDDWKLNGDLLIYFPKLDIGLELMSIGIRVDENSLIEQMKKAKREKDLNLWYHQAIINKQLPYTIGGGIGQSRVCQFLLNKTHIGEVQSSTWPEEEIKKWQDKGIHFL